MVHDAPLIAAGMAEQAGRREEEQPPAVLPQARVSAIDIGEYLADLAAVGVEILEPVERRAFVILAVPPPVLLGITPPAKK